MQAPLNAVLVRPSGALRADIAPMNSFAFLEKSARHRPDGLALLQGEEAITYREFRDRALAVGGNLLALGCVSGDRVAFCLANSPRIMEVIFGCFAAGLVVVPINARLHVREMAYILENSSAKILIHGSEFQDGIMANADLFGGLSHRICPDAVNGALQFDALLEPSKALAAAVDAFPEDLCWLFYTSGTTRQTQRCDVEPSDGALRDNELSGRSAQ